MDNNNKKRQKLDSAALNVLGNSMEALTSFTGTQDTLMLNGGHGADLGAALPANLYFTICDEISNESPDFLAINGETTVTQVKEEHDRQSLQYRIVSQLPKASVNNNTSHSTTTTAVTLRAVPLDDNHCNTNSTPVNAASILPATTVQLPSGCEIYLVKEYVDSDGGELLLSEDCEEPSPTTERITLPQNVTVSNSASTQTIMKTAAVSLLPRTAIKAEPGTPAQFIGNNVITSKIESSALKVAASAVASNYKKRDEKRRATHNEVERRRRDKINSWIFKLKEMLPTDVSSGNLVSTSKVDNVRNVSAGASGRLPVAVDGVEKTAQQIQQRGANNCRSPPNDSKSQILIKACEYIRVMQDEVKSLRECLMENEKLRTSNQRLQIELQKLKNAERQRLSREQQQQQQTCDDSFSSSNNCGSPSDDFTLTLCTNGNNHLDDVTSSTLFAAATTPTSPTSIALLNGRKASITVPYTKRELIITDYVD